MKFLGTLVVLLLTGAAVAVGGTIGFVGLVIPHIVRFIVGPDYRLIIPCSAVIGALLLVFADVGARMINPPFETPVGAITAMIGVPFFLYLARQEGRGCNDEYNAKNHVRVDDPAAGHISSVSGQPEYGNDENPVR